MGNRLGRLMFAVAVPWLMAAQCDTTSTGARPSLNVTVGPCDPGIDSGCYRGYTLTAHGTGYPANSRVKIYAPTRTWLAQDVVITPGTAPSASGEINAGPVYAQACRAVAHFDDLPGLFWVVADDANGTRLTAYPIPRKTLACEPPFALNTLSCTQGLCPSLSNDGPTSVGMHWDHREAESEGRNKFRISYGVVGESQGTTTRDYGSDVADVGIHNLTSHVGYWFRLQACHSPVFGSDTCDDWETVGEAAAG